MLQEFCLSDPTSFYYLPGFHPPYPRKYDLRMSHNITEKNAKITAFTQHLQIVLKLQNTILGKSRVSEIPRIPMNLFWLFIFVVQSLCFFNTFSGHYVLFSLRIISYSVNRISKWVFKISLVCLCGGISLSL